MTERVNRILNHPLFRTYVEENAKCEIDRIFCHHDMGHFLDVARIAMILNLKEAIGASEELIYAAALLHDVGRWIQYQEGTPHEKSSAALAPQILDECGFDREETQEVLTAILDHRNREIESDKSLSGILYRADKLSRPCFFCPAEKECNWKGDKKNKMLRF